MAALHSSVASMPTWEYVFILTDAIVRTRKRGERGREENEKVLGAYGQDLLNKNGNLLLGFAEDNKLVILKTFCTPKSGGSYTFQSTNCSKELARLDFILTKQADRRVVRGVNVRRPALEASVSHHNLVYAEVGILLRSAQNRRRRERTKEIPRTADLRRLMTGPNLRCQVTKAMKAALS